MATVPLSRNDLNVLEKIKDPDFDPSASILLDLSLPRDPQITDTSVYERVIQKEREIILSMQQLELQLAGLKPQTVSEPVQEYQRLVSQLNDFITEYPNYASARNNRVQALRRLCGDTMLLGGQIEDANRLIQHPDPAEKQRMAAVALEDLERSISLLSPKMAFAAISPQAAKTLSLAYTQRAAIYHTTGKHIGEGRASLEDGRRESKWSKLDFEEAASRDFAMGGRYGNDIAKGLAVSTNPTAKLCGQMVREAMKKEYGPAYGN
ncbi:hypothetical protein SODALDRAFT_332824 [Sodiomyces alkalinus F11]|uniref:Tetratricopeptide repeat protein 36-like protein n=1 Tax=Sodiomyces alkalinus (strain CBS 110278 / VKM F-3762 / F11) TaxID=1314773 RepID=A0A3N2PYG3_SODAK|nr:hypothetical protein SODALDRAFT_332824 [Sodiomyces alkalinus F11]ROT39385.1 hypothetical protein SODALDRAFT_332824 [Sodiomyces alkalinus F11]